MKTKWDYTSLAEFYENRPDYAQDAIEAMCQTAGLKEGDLVCDVGAGTAKLTRMLLERGLAVVAVEPNEAMMNVGKGLTENCLVTWVVGTGENTGQPEHRFDMVTFGSSFNTIESRLAFKETARILKPGGWFACMWNHRDLNDPIQKRVEDYIKSQIPEYGYGTRREDQSEVIRQSGLFKPAKLIEKSYVSEVAKESYINAWRSHATLQRQSGKSFGDIICGVEKILENKTVLMVPYTTRLWMAQLL